MIPLAYAGAWADTRDQMSPSRNRGVLRALTAGGSIAALVFALVLSAIPQLHEELHAVAGAANHECAVTLLTSGNYQHTPNVTISLAPTALPTSFAISLANFQLVSAHLDFSLLEHAPPAIS